MNYIKLFERFSSNRELNQLCTDTLAYLLDDTDYKLTIESLCAYKEGTYGREDYWLYVIKLECDKIKNSYENDNNYTFLKNSGPSWEDIKDYYLPLIEVLKNDIVGYSKEQNKFQSTATLEIYYKYQVKDKTVNDTKMKCKIIPITELEDLELNDIWYINLFVKD